MLCLASPAHAKDTISGNFFLPHCETSRDDDPYYHQCQGMIAGMIYFGSSLPPDMRFCVPDNVTSKQARRVVLKFLNAHPELLHEEFKDWRTVLSKKRGRAIGPWRLADARLRES